MLILIFIGSIKPFLEKKTSHLEFFTEFMIGLITIMLVTFTEYVESPYAKFDAGWGYISLFSLVIIIQMGNVIWMSLKSVWLLIKQKYS